MTHKRTRARPAAGLHADRNAGGDRHHRHPGEPVVGGGDARAASRGRNSRRGRDSASSSRNCAKAKSQLQPHYLPSQLRLRKTTITATASWTSTARLPPGPLSAGTCCYRLQPTFAGTFIDWNGNGNANEELSWKASNAWSSIWAAFRRGHGNAIQMIGFSTLNDPEPGPPPQPQARTRWDRTSSSRPRGSSRYTARAAPAPFPVYLDPWMATARTPTAKPYAFFASYHGGRGNYLKYRAPATARRWACRRLHPAGPDGLRQPRLVPDHFRGPRRRVRPRRPLEPCAGP